MDYDSFLTAESSRRQVSPIRALMKFLVDDPEIISLGGGLPNPSLFPFTRLEVEVSDGTKLAVEGDEMRSALQYSATAGHPEILDRWRRLQQFEHSIPEDRCTPDRLAVALGNGSQDLLSKTFSMLLDEGRTVLTEAPTYPGALSYLQPLNCGVHPVESDGEGLRPESLAHTLDTWDEATQGARPRVLYLIPTGNNPAGSTLSTERRRAIYEIASRPENNLIILEDDPYYFLTFRTPLAKDGTPVLPEGGSSPTAAECRQHLTSFLSIDVDGRVLRFDSLSKVLSAGMRIGFITGPARLVNRVNLHSAASNLQPSGIPQALVLALFRHWKVGEVDGVDALGGLADHVERVVDFYEGQCRAFLDCVHRHLGDMVDYEPPRAGMFLWMRVKGVEDSRALIEGPARAHKVLLLPGAYCFPPDRATGASPPSPFVRAAFSIVTPEQMDVALSRLAQSVRETVKQ